MNTTPNERALAAIEAGLGRDAISIADSYYQRRFAGIQLESPIEELFLRALNAAVTQWQSAIYWCEFITPDEVEQVAIQEPGAAVYLVTPQYEQGNFRVDFLIECFCLRAVDYENEKVFKARMRS